MTTLVQSTERVAEPRPRRWLIWLARGLWLIVLLLVFALYSEMIPRNLVQTRYEWPVQQAMDAATRWFPFSRYVRLVVGVEYLVVGVYVGAGLLIAWKSFHDPFAIFVSGALLILSTSFGLSGNLDALHFPVRLGQGATWLQQIWPVLVLLSLALLFYLLPDGRFQPPWLSWIALPSLLALALTAYLLFDEQLVQWMVARLPGQEADSLWLILLAVMLLPLFAGSTIQLVRWSRSTADGPSARRRWLALVLLLPLASLALMTLAWLGDDDDDLGWLIFGWTLFTPMLVGLASQIYRYLTESDLIKRQQIKWLAWGLTSPILGLLVSMALRILIGDTSLFYALDTLIYPLLTTLIPISILFCILRYRLWGVDVLLNRTLLYGTLTLLIALLYMIVVGVLSTLLRGSAGLTITVLSTGLIALLFHPLRQSLQRVVNRFIYGERDDPATVMARLGQRLEGTVAPDAVLPTIVETVVQALRLPYAAIVLEQEGQEAVAVTHGQPLGTVQSFVLTYQGQSLGRLEAAPRADGEVLTTAERRLLANIAYQAGPAIHAVQLTAELQRSRAQIVAAGEEERRRLRRDLHDGLGPRLAGLSMKIDAAYNQLQNDPGAVALLLRQSRAESQEALVELRGLVYGLRPPALDQLGLVSALRDYVATRAELGALNVQVDAPDPLPPLAAAVEVAAYRITVEALNNAARHAHASDCLIKLRLADDLLIDVSDNGCGIQPDVRYGVGLTAMLERSAELGGTCTIGNSPAGGLLVSARLPLRPLDGMKPSNGRSWNNPK